MDLFNSANFVKAVSGATGSALAITFFYPLDLLRTMLQVDEIKSNKSVIEHLVHIRERFGITGLYRGLQPNIVALSVSNFVYFYTFHGLKEMWPIELQNAKKDTMFAYVAGTVNVLLTTPFWMAAVRLKLQNRRLSDSSSKSKHRRRHYYRGLIDCLTKVYKHEGIRGLWRGTFASLLLVFNPSIQFTVYEALKRYYLLYSRRKAVSSIMIFLIGAISKFIATILTYPLQVVQSLQRSGNHGSQKNSFSVFVEIIKKKGVAGLFQGLEAKLWQTVLTAALMFLIYEKLSQLILSITSKSA